MARKVLIVLLTVSLSSGPAIAEGFIYFIERTHAGGGFLRRVALDGAGVQDLIPTNLNTRHIAIDPIGGRLYYGDGSAHQVRVADLDGANSRELRGAISPYGMRVDLVNQKLYWTDDYTRAVERTNLDGSNRELLATYPRNLTSEFDDLDFDLEGGKVYWADRKVNVIFRTGLNGGTREVFRTYTYGAPVGLTIDRRNRWIYWQESNKILRTNFEIGGAVEEVLTMPTGSPFDVELDIEGGKIYWSSFYSGIYRANLDGSGIEQVYQTVGSMRGIALLISPRIYFLEVVSKGDARIRRIELDGGNPETVLNIRAGRHLGVDPRNGLLYWTNWLDHLIHRANVNGTGAVPLLSATSPYGIRLDLENDKMYWSDDYLRVISRADLSGSNREELATYPRSLTSEFDDLDIDLARGKVYWADRKVNVLFRANVSGGGREIFQQYKYGAPVGLAIDHRARMVYWQESNLILRRSLDGAEEPEIVLEMPTGSPFDVELDLEAGKIYWTSFFSGIYRADLDGGDCQQIYATPHTVRGLAFDRVFTDSDSDGVSDREEAGAPNNGDANLDGVPDAFQDHVTAVRNAVDGKYVAIVAPAGTVLKNVRVSADPSAGGLPPDMLFPVGFFQFEVDGVDPQATVQVQLLLPDGVTVDRYFKYGPPSADASPEFQEFAFDGSTGAELSPGEVRLTLQNGGRGDFDFDGANSSVSDPGGPGFPVNRPPMAVCRDVSAEADDSCLAEAFVDNGSFDPDGDAIELVQTPPGPFGLGQFSVTLQVTDEAGAADQCSAQVEVIDTAPPLPEQDPLPELRGQCRVDVEEIPAAADNCSGPLEGATSDPLQYDQQGEFTVDWVYEDESGNRSGQSQSVVVRDTHPPEIHAVTASPDRLWPPDLRMAAVDVQVEATDNCGGPVVCRVVAVTSNEPESGPGSGALAPDWEIVGDLAVLLRAERNGTGSGRVYTLRVNCDDENGNRSESATDVEVPLHVGSN